MKKVIGYSEENTTCDCCGKTNLKKTVVIETENGIVYFGVDCAAQTMLGSKKASKVKAISQLAQATQIMQVWVKKYGAIKTTEYIFNRYGFTFNTKDGAILDHNYNVIAHE